MERTFLDLCFLGKLTSTTTSFIVLLFQDFPVLYLRLQVLLPGASEFTLIIGDATLGQVGQTISFTESCMRGCYSQRGPYSCTSSTLWTKIQRGWVTCREMHSETGTKSRLESGSPNPSSSFIWVIFQIKNNTNYYLSSIYSGPGIILDTILTILIYSFSKYLLYIYVPGVIWGGNMVMNRTNQVPFFTELTV